MALRKYASLDRSPSVNVKPLKLSKKVHECAQLAELQTRAPDTDIDVDLTEVYFLIMHFLSGGPCQKTSGELFKELIKHQLLPRRYHAFYSRDGSPSVNGDNVGHSFPLSYTQLANRYQHIENDHLVKLLKQLLLLSTKSPLQHSGEGSAPTAVDVPTLLGAGAFSLLSRDSRREKNEVKHPPAYMHWPHSSVDQVRGLGLREIGGGFTRHHRAPSFRAACYAIAKPSTMAQKMDNIKRVRGHCNAVYCAILDRSGRFVITGSDDRLVKIWSMETAYCLASCRGHEGDITDLAVSSNSNLVASASNDCIIRVWRLPDGAPVSVLRGHTGAITAILFSPRPTTVYQLLSSSDDGTCRLWDVRNSQLQPRIYMPKPPDSTGKNAGPSSSNALQGHQIFCCAFNNSGTIFVTGSSDNLARVWNACKATTDDPDQPSYEIDALAGHENDVNYVQFSGCSVQSKFHTVDSGKEESTKFKNTWFSHDNIVTCSRDGSAIIWIPRSRRSHGKPSRWVRAYHLKVPPPPLPPQPPRGGPRQRILPTPRGVNMIVWSLDNRFVLAAIMDCRICVWNASDGSLVHSLTGHTESTYVLDIHPFNPRIAMSAGYDGKTIIWDIWEGKPIRTYEISHFKLVDGKFSPDGTSIILSDDVGQLYILYSGQGESHKDAKYDQFFLGDYRPLLQDTHGNVLDQYSFWLLRLLNVLSNAWETLVQETQLMPYQRNLQDLLCDAGMMPYEEPYQTMYQQRRYKAFGPVGLAYRAPTLRLAIGPDIILDQEYQIPPLADLDVFLEPLPEFNAIEFEPEIEFQSDDADSDFAVNEDDTFEGEQGHFSSCSSSSGDQDFSTDDSEGEGSHKDGIRRSKRKKHKAEVAVMTSSGRRIKRKNLDVEESDVNVLRDNHGSRKLRHKRRVLKGKSSKSKSSRRPQRAAARNALTFFSKITGNRNGEIKDDDSDEESTENDLVLDSDIESDVDMSDKSLQNEPNRRSKGKEICYDEPEDEFNSDESESHMNYGCRKKLILKLSTRGSNKPVALTDNTPINLSSSPPSLAGSSSVVLFDNVEENGNHARSLNTGCSSGGAYAEFRWGRARARSTKRQRVSEALWPNGLGVCPDDSENISVNISENSNPKNDNIMLPCLDVQTCGDKMTEVINGKELSEANQCSHLADEEDTKAPSVDYLPDKMDIQALESNGVTMDSESPELKLESPPIPSQNGGSEEAENSGVSLLNKDHFIDKQENGDALHSIIIDKLDPVAEVLQNGDASGHEQNGVRESDAQPEKGPVSKSYDCQPNPKKIQVYRRLKNKNKLRGNDDNVGNTSAAGDPIPQSNEGLKILIHEPGNNHKPEDTSESSQKNSKQSQTPSEEPGSSFVSRRSTRNRRSTCHHDEQEDGSKKTSQKSLKPEEAGSSLRSSRNRRSTRHYHDTSPEPVERRKPNQPNRKASLLMLSSHEEGSRYIPQKGDEVLYLRQGHQEYLRDSPIRESGPWTSKQHVKAAELCKVDALEYGIVPGSGDSCCKMTLKFIDPDSNVFQKSFKLTLPEVTSFPDFIVERSRFDAAIQKNWSNRDKCKVWWRNESDESGSWWDGRIIEIRAQSPEFPDSPWEKYCVMYRSEPREKHFHSPWELFDVNANTELEQPCIDDDSRDKLLSALDVLEQSGKRKQDKYGVSKLEKDSHKTQYTNRFPVPISLDLIRSRLENRYYRSLEAVKHDVEVMLSNAAEFFAKNTEHSSKILFHRQKEVSGVIFWMFSGGEFSTNR
ncbi:hypothetical protein ACFE04_014176 [Oxalis oulophora]